MYDQNPLLHKLSVDDLAATHRKRRHHRHLVRTPNLSPGIAAALSVLVAAVLAIGSGVI